MDLTYDLVVVAGGGGQRLGGELKAAIERDGSRLLDRTLAATRGASARVLVGSGIEVPDDVVVTMEDPAGGGPAAGTAAGLVAVSDPSPWTLVLAGDLVDAAPGVGALLAAAADASEETDGICLAGAEEHPQWLFGIHRTPALRSAVEALDTVQDRSMKALLSGLRLRTVPVDPDVVADIDTPEDLTRWEGRRPGGRPRNDLDDTEATARWGRWVRTVAQRLDVDAAAVDVTLIHDLTKVVAHTYERPMAPVAAYLLGMAVGAARERGESPDLVALRETVESTLADAPRAQDSSGSAS